MQILHNALSFQFVSHYDMIDSRLPESYYSSIYTKDSAMNHTTNKLGQPVGLPLADWKESRRPERKIIEGRYCVLEPLEPARHADELFEAYSQDSSGALWTYLPYGPFESLPEFSRWMSEYCLGDDPFFYAIRDKKSGLSAGMAGYLRITPSMGTIEVGHINYAPSLQRTSAASEAMFLMMKYAFELGYRRYEWKCDSLNEGSEKAAARLGFSYEGTFRQAVVYRGRNRDTAWYSVIDSEWPALRAAYERWLSSDNFDLSGRQKVSLSELTSPLINKNQSHP